jgi:hypothetical protein
MVDDTCGITPTRFAPEVCLSQWLDDPNEAADTKYFYRINSLSDSPTPVNYL